MTGPAMIRPASSHFWKAPQVSDLANAVAFGLVEGSLVRLTSFTRF